MMNSSTLLFVYGHLRKGAVAGHLVGNSKALGEFYTAPKYQLLSVNDEYPALISGEQQVIGEIFQVETRLFEAMDAYENVPTAYTRETIEIVGISEAVQAYIWQGETELPVIESGDWLSHLAALGQ